MTFGKLGCCLLRSLSKAGIWKIQTESMNKLYDLLIEEDCKVGDHSNALTIAYEMEAAGRMATTFHFNCLLSLQATCGIPEIVFTTFENMEYGEAYMKPDTESYNWVIQAYTRAESYDSVIVSYRSRLNEDQTS